MALVLKLNNTDYEPMQSLTDDVVLDMSEEENALQKIPEGECSGQTQGNLSKEIASCSRD